jgi:hypothetical protein
MLSPANAAARKRRAVSCSSLGKLVTGQARHWASFIAGQAKDAPPKWLAYDGR